MTTEPGSPLRVVVAEDEALIRLDLVEMLRDEGYDVVGQAGDGEEAVRLAEELRPDVVMLDVKMPVLDGISAAERITGARIAPVVMLTAMGDTKGTVDAINAGVRQYLHKPFKSADLIAKIAKTLREGPRAAPPAPGMAAQPTDLPEKDLPSFEIEIDMEGLDDLDPSKA